MKVYGRDAYDTQLSGEAVAHRLVPRAGAPPTLSRLQQAEHEAFLTLLARQAGVPTQEVVTAGATADDDALLVLRGGGQVLGDLPADRVSDDLLHRLWGVLHVLQRATSLTVSSIPATSQSTTTGRSPSSTSAAPLSPPPTTSEAPMRPSWS